MNSLGSLSRQLYRGVAVVLVGGALCTRDFSFGVFCAGDCIGVASVCLRVLATGRFLEVCGVESLWREWPGVELLL